MRCTKDWNKFKKSVTKLNHGKLSYAKFKSLLTSHNTETNNFQNILKFSAHDYILEHLANT